MSTGKILYLIVLFQPITVFVIWCLCHKMFRSGILLSCFWYNHNEKPQSDSYGNPNPWQFSGCIFGVLLHIIALFVILFTLIYTHLYLWSIL